MNHQEPSEQVKPHGDWMSALADELTKFYVGNVRTPFEVVAIIAKHIPSNFPRHGQSAPPVAAPTQKAVEAAREIHGAISDLQNGLCAYITIDDIAAILSRHFPAPATATEQEDTRRLIHVMQNAAQYIWEREGDDSPLVFSVREELRKFILSDAARQSATQQKEQKK